VDRLDPGLSKRPSRFDRKYLFPLPSLAERTAYCEFWRRKLQGKDIKFPQKLCHAIASITDEFSFAYLQEAFVATLLEIAHQAVDLATGVRPYHGGGGDGDGDDDDLDQYQLWRVMKRIVAALKRDMGESNATLPSSQPRNSVPSSGSFQRAAIDEASGRLMDMTINNPTRRPTSTQTPDLAGLANYEQAMVWARGRQQSESAPEQGWALPMRGGERARQVPIPTMNPEFKLAVVNSSAIRYAR
jgi:hypothetical protein